MSRREIGEIVHVDEDWPYRSAIVLATRRRGLDLMPPRQARADWHVALALPRPRRWPARSTPRPLPDAAGMKRSPRPPRVGDVVEVQWIDSTRLALGWDRHRVAAP